jgi:hypothetical protein
MTLLVGLCGPEGAGKSTAAKALRSVYRAEVLPMAAPLKRMLEGLGVPSRHLYGTPSDKAQPLAMFGGRSMRDAMQTLGTEWGRAQFGDMFWLDAWLAAVDQVGPGKPLIVADDVRFPNEAAAIRDRGGLVICVIRDVKDFKRVPRHASEAFAKLPYTHIAHNSGTEYELEATIRRIVSRKLRPTTPLLPVHEVPAWL